MPSRTVVVPNLKQVGAVLEVSLHIEPALIQFMRAQEQAIPSAVALWALIDIGASRTAVQRGIIEPWGIATAGPVDIHGVGGTVVRGWRYPVRLNLGENIVADCAAVSMEIGVPGIECVIGRDVLARGELIYRGREDSFTLTF